MKITKETFTELKKRYAKLWPWPDESEFDEDPFKKLIITVLSQNTSDVNTGLAYKGLSSKFKIEPHTLANADVREIRNAIKHGGLQNVKSRKIKEISKYVLENFNSDISFLLKLPKEEARERLKKIPGVGDKTADVMLTSTYGYKEVIPIDTHMNRISKRLGLVDENADYDEIQKALLGFVPKEFREKGFGYLWLLAKHTCKSQNPDCDSCLFLDICKYRR